MEQITRKGQISQVEADKYDKVRKQVKDELPDLIERHLGRTTPRPKFGFCHDCNIKMTYLKTTYGDPEGIRKDQECPKCGSVYGCTKGGQTFLRSKYGSYLKNWRPAKEGDPHYLSFDSCELRKLVEELKELINNLPDTAASNKVGRRLSGAVKAFEKRLDERAKNYWEAEKEQRIIDERLGC